MRRKKAIKNIFFSFLLEGFSLLSGFIVPRMIISAFGSETNGMLNSIANFIGYIALLQSGMGSVAKAALYKPLAEKDSVSLNTLVSTIEAFFRKIALATVVYVSVLSVLYPVLIAKEFDFLYTASLVIIIGIGTVAQYYFGITYQMLVEADQNSYIYSILQIISVSLNTLCVVLLIKLDCSIQIVKLASAAVFLIRPLFLNRYVRKKYKITTKVPQDKSLLKQRWDGFLHAIAYFIHAKTDVFVLTVFTSFSCVSVYSVYMMITTALTAMVKIIDKAISAALGNIYALNETSHLKKTFQSYSTLTHIITTVLFSTAAITVCSFVKIYTDGFSDADYIQPLFSFIIISAELLYCLRLAYNSIIYATGKFRETRNSAIIEAIINITISCILVGKLKLIGVAIGTLAAMLYRTVYFIWYLRNNVVYLNMGAQIKRYAVSLSSYIGLVAVASKINVVVNTYFSWILYAGTIFTVVALLTLLINFVFYKDDVYATFSIIKSTIRKRR